MVDFGPGLAENYGPIYVLARALILVRDARLKLLLKQDKVGFQPSKQGREELPGLILQSMLDESYY